MREGRTIVFIDESGLSERPTFTRTWSPVGQTPLLRFSHSWGKLSMIAGISWWKFYFKLYRGSIRSEQAIDFLKQLQRQITKPLLIIWDGLAVHRSRKVRQWVESTEDTVILAQLPPYAPELNPVEYLWAHLKCHQLAHFCPKDLWELSNHAKKALLRARRRPSLIRAFWKQAELAL